MTSTLNQRTNNIHPQINYVLEIEQNYTINLLDLTITTKNTKNTGNPSLQSVANTEHPTNQPNINMPLIHYVLHYQLFL